MVGVTALEARLKAALADSAPIAAAARAADDLLAAGIRTPLKFAGFSDHHIVLDHLVLLLYLDGAKLLDLVDRVSLLAAKFHAGQLHGHTVRDFRAKVVTLAVNTELVPAFEREKVTSFVLYVADIAHLTSAFLDRLSRMIDKFSIKVID